MERSKKEEATRKKIMKELSKVEEKMTKIHAKIEALQEAAGANQLNSALVSHGSC